MKLLLLNAFKGLKKKKIQMLSIILLITLATGIYVAMNSALDRLEDEYYDYIEKQNTEHVSFSVVIDLKSDVTLEDLKKIDSSSLTSDEFKLIEYYSNLIKYQKVDELDLNTSELITNILSKTGVTHDVEIKKIESLKDKYNFEYEYQKSKTTTIDQVVTKLMPYDKNKKINIPYLVEGSFPNSHDEITILPAFAKANDIKINDEYEIAGFKYKVVGYAYAPDYIYPMISYSTPIFDEEKNNIIYMYEEDYDSVTGILDNTYSLVFNGDYSRKFEIEINPDPDTKSDDKMQQMFEEGLLKIDTNTITRMARISALQLEFAVDRNFATYFLYLLLGISVFIIIVITKKRIDDERLQIGVLKALGYNRFSIALSYLVYPIIGSIIGGILGYIIGNLFNTPLTSLYLNYFNVPLSTYQINLKYLFNSIMIPMLMLSILSYVIAVIMLNKKPLKLLKEGSNLKVNFVSKIVNKITIFLPFDYRFKYSLASRSLGKLIIVSLTSFSTGLLIVLVLIGANLFNNMLDATFDSINYKKMVLLNSIYYSDEVTDNQDLILNMNGTVKMAKRDDTELDIKKDDEDITISLTGIDNATNYFDIRDIDENIITSKLKDSEGIIINRNLNEQLGYDVGDILTLDINGTSVKYEIIAISSENMSYIGYVNRKKLSDSLGLEKNAYNQVYSNDSKYDDLNTLDEDERNKIAYILDTDELRDNIMKQMDTFNASIYIVIFFASLMAFIIIAVIANIVVEENKKTISLLKVMGYKDKKIRGIVLNIYTPFVIVAYLLSIPAMIKLLKWIISLLVGDMNMTIPITLSPTNAIIGLIGLLVAYYIAISISKKVLNKVPLAVALKRE